MHAQNLLNNTEAPLSLGILCPKHPSSRPMLFRPQGNHSSLLHPLLASHVTARCLVSSVERKECFLLQRVDGEPLPRSERSSLSLGDPSERCPPLPRASPSGSSKCTQRSPDTVRFSPSSYISRMLQYLRGLRVWPALPTVPLHLAPGTTSRQGWRKIEKRSGSRRMVVKYRPGLTTCEPCDPGQVTQLPCVSIYPICKTGIWIVAN